MYTHRAIATAVKSGNQDEIKRILSSNPSIFMKEAAFFEAIDVGQYEIFSMLFRKHERVEISSELLARAIVGGNPEIFRCLLNKASTRSFDINIHIDYSHTLLMIAAFKGNTAICSILLEKGAEINLSNRSNKTALYNAIEKGHLETCQLLLRNNANFTPNLFERAIINGHPKICSFLLDEGIAQISLSNNIRETSFGLAIIQGHLEICELLFAHGASLDYQDHMHETFLHLACREKKLEIAKFIFEQMSNEIALSVNKYEQSAIQVWGASCYSNQSDQYIEDEDRKALCAHIDALCSDIL